MSAAYSKAAFAAHVAYLCKTCAAWAGDLFSDGNLAGNVDPEMVRRFTEEIGSRLKHFDARAATLRDGSEDSLFTPIEIYDDEIRVSGKTTFRGDVSKLSLAEIARLSSLAKLNPEERESA